jgi:hypothetical protein
VYARRRSALSGLATLAAILLGAGAAADETSDVSITRDPFALSATHTFELYKVEDGSLLDSGTFATSGADCTDAGLLVDALDPPPAGITVTDTTPQLCPSNFGGSLRITSPDALELAVCSGSGPCSYPADIIPPGGREVSPLTYNRSTFVSEESDVDITRDPFGLSATHTFELRTQAGGILDSGSFTTSGADCTDAGLLVDALNPTPFGITVTDTTPQICPQNFAGSLHISSSVSLQLTVCSGGGPCTYPDDVIGPGGREVSPLTYNRQIESVPTLSPWALALLAGTLAGVALRRVAVQRPIAS